jgi:hypothetical protein
LYSAWSYTRINLLLSSKFNTYFVEFSLFILN